ncbi:hypothetical protein [Bradyrhizobium sp. USDA 3364]
MGFFSGPSKYVTVRMGQGVASIILQLRMLDQLDQAARNEILNRMKAEGAPTSMDELISSAGSVIREHEMGSWKKAQFLGAIRSTLIGAGMSGADAAYLTGMIELSRGLAIPFPHTKRGLAEPPPPQVSQKDQPSEEPKQNTEGVQRPRHDDNVGTDDADAKLTKLIENNILVANKHAEAMREKTNDEARDYVRTIFETNDVVWGVWNDPRDGVGMFPLKGDAVLRRAMAGAGVTDLKMSAVICSAEDGLAARRRERGE